MALFGMKVKSRRKAGIGGFHAEYLNDRTAIRQRKQMGYLRTLFSALSLLFGAFMIYIAMFYIPAFVQPKKVLNMVTEGSLGAQTYDFERESTFHRMFGPYLSVFKLNRAYMQPGQSIQIKYDLPAGAHVKLEVSQCRRAWVVEIFDCRVLKTFNARTQQRSGIETFSLQEGGFYHFDQTVVGVPAGEPYRLVWQRE